MMRRSRRSSGASNVSVGWSHEYGQACRNIEIECSVSAGDPGCTCGPPERCYPAEDGEVEILAVTDDAGLAVVWDGVSTATWSRVDEEGDIIPPMELGRKDLERVMELAYEAAVKQSKDDFYGGEDEDR